MRTSGAACAPDSAAAIGALPLPDTVEVVPIVICSVAIGVLALPDTVRAVLIVMHLNVEFPWASLGRAGGPGDNLYMRTTCRNEGLQSSFVHLLLQCLGAWYLLVVENT